MKKSDHFMKPSVIGRPYTTLFMLMSVDGKISTGDSDSLDIDKDYQTIIGLKEGLQQYYDLEQQTDLFSLNTGRVFSKIGMNEKTDEPTKSLASFIVIDNKPHLNENGITYVAKKAQKLIIVTTDAQHPAYAVREKMSNIECIFYDQDIDFSDLMHKLRQEHGIENLTIQSGGTLNTCLVRDGLVDRVLLVIAPALIGGKNTATLMDGESLHTPVDLAKIKTLDLVRAEPLEGSYLVLEYKVRHV